MRTIHQIDGFRHALDALSALDENSRSRILAHIAKQDPALSQRLRDGMISFGELQFLSKNDFQALWWECPRNQWQLALRKAPRPVLEMLRKYLSTRALSEILDSVQSLGPQPLSRVLGAQKFICSKALELRAQGLIAVLKA